MDGNDVVDIGDREALPESRHPRFDHRVFTVAEHRLIGASRCPNQLRWMLWASKESAYKLVKRQDPSTVFLPRAFEVEMDFSGVEVRIPHRFPSPGRQGGEMRRPARVHHQGSAVCVQIDLHGDAVHAVATLSRNDTERVISALGATASDPGGAVRDLARRHLARALACDPGDIEIISGSSRIPEVRIGGSRAPGFISLSHHGRFVAFAFVPHPPQPGAAGIC